MPAGFRSAGAAGAAGAEAPDGTSTRGSVASGSGAIAITPRPILATTLAKDREALAGGSLECAHVLDHAGDLQRDLVRHLGGSPGDLLGGRLRRGDDQELG